MVGSEKANHYCDIPGNISYCSVLLVKNDAMFTFNYRDPASLPIDILSTFTFTK